LVNELLVMCENIRVKRLFLFLTNYFNHPWAKHIKKDNLELGVERMQVVKNGVFDNEFLITVPKQYHVRCSHASTWPPARMNTWPAW
ncbi:MAG: hypothetical protein GX780_07440, partial [Campylobacteraceae bacterium]|nr:hypothetical protein [Campylobacteraceae bacterium]